MVKPNDLIKSHDYVEIDGEKYRLDDLTASDYIEIEDVIRKMRPNPVESAMAVISGMKEGDPLRETLAREALDKQGKAGIVTAEELEEFKDSPLGFFHMLWRMMRKSRPEMTLQEAMNLIEKLGQECFEKFAKELDGMPEKNSSSPGETLKTAAEQFLGPISSLNSAGLTGTTSTPSEQ